MATQSSLSRAKSNFRDACKALSTVETALNRYRGLVRTFAVPLRCFVDGGSYDSNNTLSHVSRSLAARINEMSAALHDLRTGVRDTQFAVRLCVQNLRLTRETSATARLNSVCENVIDGVNALERTVAEVERRLEAESSNIMELALRIDLPADVLQSAADLLDRVCKGFN